jgi:hypothetical protein
MDEATEFVWDDTGPTPLADARPVRLDRMVADREFRCRCGTKIPPAATCYLFSRYAPVLQPLVEDRVFCHILCARAWLREAIEEVEGRGSFEVTGELREVYCSLQELFNLVEIQLTSPA